MGISILVGRCRARNFNFRHFNRDTTCKMSLNCVTLTGTRKVCVCVGGERASCRDIVGDSQCIATYSCRSLENTNLAVSDAV